MNSRPETLLDRAGRFTGPILFLISLVVYLLTLSRYAFPGESARLIVLHTGIDPFPPMSHLLWNWMVRLIAAVPVFDVVLRLNLFSALCGAGSVWLLYEVVSRIPHNRTYEEIEARFPAAPVQRLSGVFAALIFAFCIPFWIVSNRAHTASLDVLLLLSAILLLMVFDNRKRPALIYGFALLYGLGTTEFATFIVLAPLFALALLFVLWRAEMLKAAVAGRLVLCYLLGLSIYFFSAWSYELSPAFKWRSFTSYFQALWYIWREQYRTIRFSLPQVGWLLIFLVSVLPAMIVVVFPKRATNRSAVWSSNFLHALLGVLALLVIFNVPIAPWPLLKLKPLLVTPYMIVAIWVGYLAGYWYIFLWQRSRFEPRNTAMVKAALRTVYLPLLALIVAASLLLNLRVADGRASASTKHFADLVVERMEGREWLISNGLMDDLLTLSAKQKGVGVKILNTSQGAAEAYLRYVATLFDNTRLKGLAQVGLGPLMSEWMSSTPGIERQVAVLAVPDIWYSAGFTPVPDRLVFVGSTNIASIDPDAYFKQQKAFWEGLGPELKRQADRPNLEAEWSRWALTHVSKIANNTGVLLEDLGRTNDAFASYQAALNLDTNNLSALMNCLWVAQRDSRPEKAALEAMFDSFGRRLRARIRIWSLAYHYGYIRNPEMFAQRGWAWAMSGKPNLAVSEMQKAVAMGADRQQADLAVANFYFMQNMDTDSERTYVSILEKNPTSPPALIGLARIAMRKGDFETARGYLARLREQKSMAALVRLEEAVVEALAGNVAESTKMLTKMVEENPKNIKAWALLSILASANNDEQTLDRCLNVLKGAANSPNVLLTLAQVAMSRGDLDDARKYLDDILKIQPENKQALEMLLRIDVRQGDRGLAEDHLEKLLSVDPRNALGNLVLGSIQYSREEYELAEVSYRISLESDRSDRALNDLAWLLQRKGKDDEALKLAREALERNKKNASAWDTMGVILMKMNNLDEAQSAFQQALSLQPGNAHFILHVAQLYDRKGMKEEALRLADPLLVRPSEMSAENFETVRSLVRRLRGSSS